MRAATTLLAALLLPASAALAEPIAARGRITRVTVYADRAEVTREAEVVVPAGDSEVSFAGIPLGVDADSLLVRGRGVAASIGSIELRSRVAEEAPDGPSDAGAELARIDAELARLSAEQANDASLKHYLDQQRDAAGRTPPAATTPVSPDAAGRMLTFLEQGYARLSDRELARSRRRGELVAARELAAARVQAGRPQPEAESWEAVASLTSEGGGTLRLELSYVVGGASWGVAYRATLAPAGATIELVSEAVVAQSTGEDWTDVALTLSTAQPARGIEPPTLQAQSLGPAPQTSANDSVEGGLRMQVPLTAIQNFKLITSGASAQHGEQSTGVAEIVTSSATLRTGLVASYDVPGRSDVASDGAEHRLRLRTDELQAKIGYVVIPELSDDAYAVALAKAPEDRPLLAGSVRVVAAGALLGTFDMPDTAPGTEISIPFGPDRRLSVKRRAEPPVRDEGSRDVRLTRSATTTVSNGRDARVTVTLRERIPLPADERITVKAGPKTTDGSTTEDGRPGILTWTFELEPKESRSVTLQYEVRHPKDIVLPPF